MAATLLALPAVIELGASREFACLRSRRMPRSFPDRSRSGSRRCSGGRSEGPFRPRGGDSSRLAIQADRATLSLLSFLALLAARTGISGLCCSPPRGAGARCRHFAGIEATYGDTRGNVAGGAAMYSPR